MYIAEESTFNLNLGSSIVARTHSYVVATVLNHQTYLWYRPISIPLFPSFHDLPLLQKSFIESHLFSPWPLEQQNVRSSWEKSDGSWCWSKYQWSCWHIRSFFNLKLCFGRDDNHWAVLGGEPGVTFKLFVHCCLLSLAELFVYCNVIFIINWNWNNIWKVTPAG